MKQSPDNQPLPHIEPKLFHKTECDAPFPMDEPLPADARELARAWQDGRRNAQDWLGRGAEPYWMQDIRIAMRRIQRQREGRSNDQAGEPTCKP